MTDSASSSVKNSTSRVQNTGMPAKKSANDFVFGKTIGEGSFSTVYLAKDIHTRNEYASELSMLQQSVAILALLSRSHSYSN